MLKSLAGASILAIMTASVALANDHDDDVTLYRVFVGDYAAPTITVVELNQHDAPNRTWTFPTVGQSKLYSVANGAVVAAVQSDNDKVQFLSSGITFDDHGDHADIKIGDPAAIAFTLDGPRPFHLVDHDGRVVINYDKGARADILDAHDLAHGTVKTTAFPQARAHHGFVTPLGNQWLSTVASDAPTQGDAAPSRLGLRAFDASGAPTGDLATCTGIHGEAFSGAYLVAGCKEGILTATVKDGDVQYTLLPYSDDLPQGLSTGTLIGSTGIQVFLGNYGPKGLVVVDPAEAPHMQYIDLPFRRVDFVLDPAQPAQGYVLTEDGTLHRINLLQAVLTDSAKVTEPYSMDGHWNDPRPRLSMAGDQIVITDPKAGLLRLVSTDTLKQTKAIPVNGAPYNLTVAGGSGLQH